MRGIRTIALAVYEAIDQSNVKSEPVVIRASIRIKYDKSAKLKKRYSIVFTIIAALLFTALLLLLTTAFNDTGVFAPSGALEHAPTNKLLHSLQQSGLRELWDTISFGAYWIIRGALETALVVTAVAVILRVVAFLVGWRRNAVKQVITARRLWRVLWVVPLLGAITAVPFGIALFNDGRISPSELDIIRQQALLAGALGLLVGLVLWAQVRAQAEREQLHEAVISAELAHVAAAAFARAYKDGKPIASGELILALVKEGQQQATQVAVKKDADTLVVCTVAEAVSEAEAVPETAAAGTGAEQERAVGEPALTFNEVDDRFDCTPIDASNDNAVADQLQALPVERSYLATVSYEPIVSSAAGEPVPAANVSTEAGVQDASQLLYRLTIKRIQEEFFVIIEPVRRVYKYATSSQLSGGRMLQQRPHPAV
jgi:hypothetical protein